MQPFDDRTPEEMDTRNTTVITFLGRVYEKADDRIEGNAMEPAEQEQAIMRVRQRLLQLAQTSPSLSTKTTIPEKKPIPVLHQRKSWQRRMNVLALVAMMIILIGSSFFVFGLAKQHQLAQNKISQSTTSTYITPSKSGNRLIGDMLYADQVSRYLLSRQQFTQLNQSKMIDGYQVSLDRAYVDANVLILGVYAIMPYGPKADKDGQKDAHFLPMDAGDIWLTTTKDVQLPILGLSTGLDKGNSQHEQRGLLLDFDTAGIVGNSSQITLNLHMFVHCQGEFSPTYNCPKVTFAFTLPFHTGRQVITPHQAVTTNGTTFTLERVVITPSEARFYIGGWSEAMLTPSPAWGQTPQPKSIDDPWHNIKLSVQGKIYNLCTFQGPIGCPQGARTGASIPLHSRTQLIRDANGNTTSVNTGVQFTSDTELNPVYLNNDHSILGFSLLEPFNQLHSQATVTITKQFEHYVKDKQPGSSGYVGTGRPVDDKSASPWVIKFTLP
jgi:hypothetical protein